MAINTTDRENAEIILGALVYFVEDGETFGDTETTTSRTDMPTFEDAEKIGHLLGSVESWKWNREYKEIEKIGCLTATQNYRKKKIRVLQSVSPTFTTADVNPEAYRLEYGLDALPEIGETAKPFANASGSITGYIYIRLLDSLRTNGTNGELAQIILRGDLSLDEDSENNDDLKKVTYRFDVTDYPANGFANTAL